MSTKAQIINSAFGQLRISGLTTTPSPTEIQVALACLENMMAELFNQWSMDLGYNFETTPNINAQTNVQRGFSQMMITNLAMRLLTDYGKDAPQALEKQATQSMSSAMGWCAKQNLAQIQPPRRMPQGSGNTFRGVFWNRYMQPVPLAPAGPDTNTIIQGETLNYREDFTAFLGSATISSYTIAVDPLLTLVTDSQSAGVISYTLTAPTTTTQFGPWQLVQITITDSLGRTEIRFVNVNVITPPQVPQQ